MNGMNFRGKNRIANVSNIANQKKHKENVKKTEKLGYKESLASLRPRKPRTGFRLSELYDRESEAARQLYLEVYRNCMLWKRSCSSNSGLWFDTINTLAKDNLITSLPKFKYTKDYLCPSCEQGKSKKKPYKPKPVPNSQNRLHILHMDLYGPMRVESINGKQYILVIVDDYSRYTWVYFLRSKDEAPEVIIKFLKQIQVLLQAPIIIVRTDNGTKFLNEVLKAYFKDFGITHQMSTVRTTQQNEAVDQRNHTLVEAA
ncbi:retrovirus-related pol polyprotein from transposon TNT 1-94 [Tanacetum coccineum]